MASRRWPVGTVRSVSAFPNRSQTRSALDLESVTWTAPVWHRVLSYYFSIQASDDLLASYVDTVIGMFVVDRDLSEEHNPPTPGVPVRYRLIDLGPDQEPQFRLYYNDAIIAGSGNAGFVFDQLFWHINAECARFSGDFVLIHAGAVATPAGEGVLVPGASGTGKSTLVVGLIREGFSYYSDEAAAIDPIGRRLHAYPKAITLKDRAVFEEYTDIHPAHSDNAYVRNRWYVVPSRYRRDVVGSPCEVGFVFVSRYSPGAPTSVQRITQAEAGFALGRNVINIGRYGPRVLPLLSDLVDGTTCYSIESGNLREAVAAITKVTGVSPRS